MIAIRFRTVGWVAGVAAAALMCYLVTQRVAAERAELKRVEHRILSARRDIRRLETEIATRGRMPQLERWNAEVLALTAPRAGQYLTGEMQLASLNRPAPGPVDPGQAPAGGVRQASYAAAAVPAAAAAAAGEAVPVLRQATYLKPREARLEIAPTRAALGDAGFEAELERLAAAETRQSKR